MGGAGPCPPPAARPAAGRPAAPCNDTGRGSARSCTHRPPSSQLLPGLGSCSCRVQAAAWPCCLHSHPWSLVVLGKGRSWNQPVVGSVRMVSRGNSTWGGPEVGSEVEGACTSTPCCTPLLHQRGRLLAGENPGHTGSLDMALPPAQRVHVPLCPSRRVLTCGHLNPKHGETTGVQNCPPGPCPMPLCPELLTRPKKSFLPTMSQSHTSTLSTASPGSPSATSNSSTSSQRGKRVFLITCRGRGPVAVGFKVPEPLGPSTQHPDSRPSPTCGRSTTPGRRGPRCPRGPGGPGPCVEVGVSVCGGCSGQGAHPHQSGPCTPMSPLFPQLSWAHQAPMGQPEGAGGGDAGESGSPFPSSPALNPFLLPSLGAKWHSEGGALLSLLAVPMAIPLPWYPLRLPWQRDAASAACSAASIPPSGSRVCGHTHAHMQTRVHTRAHAHQRGSLERASVSPNFEA